MPNLALHLAMHTPIGANPLLDYLIVSADTVGHGLERLVRYLRLVNPSNSPFGFEQHQSEPSRRRTCAWPF